jgi:hypothetical protein
MSGHKLTLTAPLTDFRFIPMEDSDFQAGTPEKVGTPGLVGRFNSELGST